MPKEVSTPKVDNNPQPIVNKAIPPIMKGVKYPNTVTKIPPARDEMTTDNNKGKISMPDLVAVDPLTAWKYMGS